MAGAVSQRRARGDDGRRSASNAENETVGRTSLSPAAGMLPAARGTRLTSDGLDLDVDQWGWLGLGVLFDLRLLRVRLGVVDGLQVFVDRVGRRLGGLVDKELDSGLRHFNRYGINKHEIILLPKSCQAPVYTL